MEISTWNEDFIAWTQHRACAFDFKLYFAFLNQDTLVGGMDEIEPGLAGLVNPQVASEAILLPGLCDRFLIKRPSAWPSGDLKFRHLLCAFPANCTKSSNWDARRPESTGVSLEVESFPVIGSGPITPCRRLVLSQHSLDSQPIGQQRGPD